MKVRSLLSICLITFLSSCSIASTSSSSSSSSNSNFSYELKDPSFYDTPKRTSESDFVFDDLFDLGNTVLINVEISDEELYKLQKDYETGYKSEIYRLADKVSISIINYGTTFTWTFDNVGIRQKGNTSRQSIYDGDYTRLNQNHYKLSFDETFDDEELYDSSFIQKYGNEKYKDREFLDMSGIDIKWDKNYDSTHIREIYASYLYHAAGIITPHVGLAKMVFKFGEYSHDFGLCMIYEKASKSMIKRALKEESVVTMTSWDDEKEGTFGVVDEKYGDLYKCSYGVGKGSSNGADLTLESIAYDRIGVGNVSGSYIPTYERKTNEDVSYNDVLLKNFIRHINSNFSTIDSISKYVDLDYLAIEEAVSYIVGNPDAMRYNYNNYMIYMRRIDGKAIIIPIDNDRCFGITKDWNVRDGLKDDEILSKRTSNDNQRNPLLNKTIFANDNRCKELYLDYVNKIVNSKWVSNETFNSLFNKAKKSYENHLRSDEVFALKGNHNIEFSTYMEAKLSVSSNFDSTVKNVYIVGTFNDWGNYSSQDKSLYKMNHLGEGIYNVEVEIKKVESDSKGTYIKMKFNNGYDDYSQIDWTLSSDLTILIQEVGKSVYVYDVSVGDILSITINTNTNEAKVEIK